MEFGPFLHMHELFSCTCRLYKLPDNTYCACWPKLDGRMDSFLFFLCCDAMYFRTKLARTVDNVVFAEVLLKFDIYKFCNRVASIKSAAFIACFGTYADR
jgi:hypothetical protein